MTLQADFRAGLLDATIPAPSGLLDGTDATVGKRYDVYRNNVTHSLIAALRTAFPLVRKLLGDRNFSDLAPVYVRAHPPTSPLMMFYGADFPTFIEGFEPLHHIGYLADAARLDMALRKSYHAEDTTVLTAARLQEIPPAQLGATSFALTPATHILRSDWPLFDIWRFNVQDGAPAPQAISQDILITRPEFDPMPHLLPPGGAAWLLAIARGDSFESAATTAEIAHPGFDLATMLTLALGTGALKTPRNKDMK